MHLNAALSQLKVFLDILLDGLLRWRGKLTSLFFELPQMEVF
jgi:hypothetical protein